LRLTGVLIEPFIPCPADSSEAGEAVADTGVIGEEAGVGLEEIEEAAAAAIEEIEEEAAFEEIGEEEVSEVIAAGQLVAVVVARQCLFKSSRESQPCH
jgi:hypothetical protein